MINRFKCFVFDHDWSDWSERWFIGSTTAPHPAIDEAYETKKCNRCGLRHHRFAGFKFDE